MEHAFGLQLCAVGPELPIAPRDEAHCPCQSSYRRWLKVAPEPPVSIGGELIVWVVVPDGVVKVADVTVALPGHQARKRPLPTVVATRVPSLKTNVAVDTG